jgi:hypothetical protein
MNEAEAQDIVHSAVDIYTHSTPDLLPRRLDDLALAAEMKRDGFRAAVHRHQFSATGERAKLVSDATGFDMRGAVALNGTAGGLNPIVVEYSIRMGACIVSMPTLSGSRYQARISEYARVAATLAGPVPVVDDRGQVLAAVHDILNIVHDHGVVLNLGYLDYADCMAVLKTAHEHGVEKIVATNPMSIMGLTEDQVDEIMAFGEVTLEFASSRLRPRDGQTAPAVPTAASAIRRFGTARCLLSSDVSAANELTALQLLTLACIALADQGITPNELRSLVRDTPARLIGVT